MPDIMVLFACLSQCVEPTPLRQLGRVIEAMLAMSGRVTMRGLSRSPGKGGSYRTIQRFFNASLNWCHLNWLVIRYHVLDADDVVLMSGDHVVVTKAGKMTYGLDRFFSSLYGKGGRVFSELTRADCKRPHVFPGHAGAGGKARRGVGARAAPDEGQWPTRTAVREQESQPSRGGTEPVASFHPRAYQEGARADRRCLQGRVLSVRWGTWS